MAIRIAAKPPTTITATIKAPVKAIQASKGGRPSLGRKLITLRLDPAVIEKFRATGPGWQARINDALRKA